MRSIIVGIHLSIILTLSGAGCSTNRPPATAPDVALSTTPRSKLAPSTAGPPSSGTPGGVVSRRQLQSRLMAYADRYLNRMSESCDSLETLHPTPQCRVAAHATKYYPGLTVLSLASEPEPETAMLDLLVVVSLERMVWADGWANEVFGDDAHILTSAQQDMESEIWRLAASVLTAVQIQEMHDLIEQWRREHPERRYVSSMRFDDLAALRAQRPETQLSHGMLAPVDEATRAIDEARLLGERALFLATRMPLVLHWQTELLANELAAKPEFQTLMSNSSGMTEAAKRIADVTQQLPDRIAEQRTAFMRDVDMQQDHARQTLRDVRAGLDDATELVAQIDKVAQQSTPLIDSAQNLVHNADATLASADRLAARIESWQNSAESATQPSHPFDIREYTAAAEKMNDTLKELNQALTSTHQLLESPARAGLIQHVDDIVSRGVAASGEEARTSINKLFWKGVLLIGLACAAFIITGWIRRLILHRQSG